MSIDFVFSLAVVIMSVVVHEVSHGYAAYSLGDNTAKYEGRLTFNPLRHLDPIGSFLVPFVMSIAGGPIFGWARPVPYNPYNLSNQKWGPAYVAAAGPFSNIVIAFVFGLLIRFSDMLALPHTFIQAALLIALINVVLACFNLIPIPPLDGSKILFAVLPFRFLYIQQSLERYGFFLVIIFIFVLWRFFLPFVFLIFSFITGISLDAF